MVLFYSSIMLTSGHAYAGDWKRGIKFLGYEMLAIGAGSIIAYCSEEYLTGRTLAGTGYIIAASIPIYVRLAAHLVQKRVQRSHIYHRQ